MSIACGVTTVDCRVMIVDRVTIVDWQMPMPDCLGYLGSLNLHVDACKVPEGEDVSDGGAESVGACGRGYRVSNSRWNKSIPTSNWVRMRSRWA